MEDANPLSELPDKKTFNAKLKEIISKKKREDNLSYFSKEQYSQFIQEVNKAKVKRCPLCRRTATIAKEQASARSNLQSQASRMWRATAKKFPPVSVGDTVTVPVPDVDRGRGDPRKVVGVEVTADGFYRLGTELSKIAK